MTGFVITNFFNTTLSAAASSSATTLSVASSTNLPTSLAPGQMFPIVLNDAATRTLFEVCYVTAISGTTLTVLRAQEGTTAQNWSVGDYIRCVPTAGTAPVLGETLHQPDVNETYTPYTLRTVIMPASLSEDITITIEPGTTVGQKIIAYGGNYAVTYQSNVTSGSPSFVMPDGSSVFSWTVPANEYGQGIELDWDGTNWRAATFGQTVVAPAASNNQAVQLGQVAGVQGDSTLQTISNAASGTTYTTTLSFTAPTAGIVLINANFSSNGNGSSGSVVISMNGNQLSSSGWGVNQFVGYTIPTSVSAGSVTIELAYTPGNTVSGNTFNNLSYLFVPTP